VDRERTFFSFLLPNLDQTFAKSGFSSRAKQEEEEAEEAEEEAEEEEAKRGRGILRK
jgi:hypothetical protein